MATHASKPLTWFKPDPAQPRRQFDEDELRRLGESLTVRQLQPVLARPDGTLIAGERRLRAATLAGLTHLDVVITDEALTPTQLRGAQVEENLHRSDLTDFEKWKAFAELLALNPGWTNRDLAAHLHLSEPTVTKYLSPSKCVPEVRAALEAGTLGITDVYTISRAGPDEQRDLLRLKLAGESRDALATRVKRQKAATAEAVRVKRVACPLPSGVSVVAAGRELSLDELIDSLGEAQKEARKAREQGLDIRTFSKVMADKAKKGGA